MKMDKVQISEIFEQIAAILELKGENVFKVRAYQNAAHTLQTLDEDLGKLIESGKLTEIKGIGKNLAEHITELATTGKLKEYESIHKSVPNGVLQMLQIQGLGPKKVKVLWEELNVTTIDTLELMCRQNKISALQGFGEKTQEKILQGIQFLRRFQGRFLFCDAYVLALELQKAIAKNSKTIRSEIAGSLRRKKEIIGDIDILASSKDPAALMETFTNHPLVEAVTAKGSTKSSVILKTGINADLRVVNDEEYPFALHYFTGSKQHNVEMRSLAKKHDLKLSEYGLFKGDKTKKCKDEHALFKALGLNFIEPELREGTGEIEAAAKGKLPKLIEQKDIRGILHVHSDYSDGLASIEEMAAAAKKMGLEYIGIADHSKSASYAGGLSYDKVKKQHQEIDRLNRKMKGFKILKGIECDILEDGSLDYSESVLKTFDFVIAAIHSRFNMDEAKMTKRLCKALENPYTKILAHPTGRLLLAREGYPVDVAKLIECAASNNATIELNANPNRLDLDWRWLKRAKESGLKIPICTDSHDTQGLKDLAFGIGIARKGWLEKKDVLNTMSTDELIKYFKD